MNRINKTNIAFLSFVMGILCLTIIISSSFKPIYKQNLPNKIKKAVCVLYPTMGNLTSGTIDFISTDSGMKVTGVVKGLTKGKHGIHIHECGDCSAADGSSAGGHFNPGNKSHGAPMDMNSHLGDLGNLVANDAGTAKINLIDKMLMFDGDNSIIGRSVIIHKSEDDLKTQPTGNSGSRIACGVIGISK